MWLLTKASNFPNVFVYLQSLGQWPSDQGNCASTAAGKYIQSAHYCTVYVRVQYWVLSFFVVAAPFPSRFFPSYLFQYWISWLPYLGEFIFLTCITTEFPGSITKWILSLLLVSISRFLGFFSNTKGFFPSYMCQCWVFWFCYHWSLLLFRVSMSSFFVPLP